VSATTPSTFGKEPSAALSNWSAMAFATVAEQLTVVNAYFGERDR
jgi:hypothetical protein